MDKEEIRQKLKALVKEQHDTAKKCTVLSVSADPVDGLMICDCQPLDGTSIIEDALLCASYPENKAGFVLVPKEGSVVIVTFINHDNDNAEAFVSMVSEVDYIYLNGSEYGGLIKVADLASHYNLNLASIKAACTTAFTAVDAALNAITPGSGVSTAAYQSASAAIKDLSRADIENTKVTHGAGTMT